MPLYERSVGFASLQSLWAFISGILALLAPPVAPNAVTLTIIAKVQLSLEKHHRPCLLMNALLVSHPCETLGVQLRASMPALEKRGEVLLLGQAEPTMMGIEVYSTTVLKLFLSQFIFNQYKICFHKQSRPITERLYKNKKPTPKGRHNINIATLPVSRVLSCAIIYLRSASPQTSSHLKSGPPSRRFTPETNRCCIG